MNTTYKNDTEKAMEIISNSILSLIQATKKDNSYNAQALAIDALKIARDYFKNNPGAIIEFIPGEPNSKTGIKSIDLLPFVTCHKRCRNTCGEIKQGRKFNKGKCYAYKLMYRNPATCARYAINTALLFYRPAVFWKGVEMLVHCERFVRCFVAGDAVHPDFFSNLFQIMINNKHCMIQGFTKCYENYNRALKKYGKQENIKFLLSGWNEMKPINPYNAPISDVYDDTLPEGWLSCGGSCLQCACVGLGCWKASDGDVVGLKKH